MRGARVFNRVDRVPAELHLLGYRAGALTMTLALVLLFVTLAAFIANLAVGGVVAVLSLVFLGFLIKIIDVIDEDKVLSEITAVRLLLRALFTRGTANY